MRVTRGHVILLFGVLAGGVGLTVIIDPGVVPSEFDQLRTSLNGQMVSRFTLGLATFVVLVAIFRLLRKKPEGVDRSPIAETPPELVTADEAEAVDKQARLAYGHAIAPFESPDYATRRVAIYGRRAETVAEIDAEIKQYLDDLAATAAKTYATSVGCDEETAKRAIKTGQWTNDRVAAAFLATDLDSEDTFTVWERVNAWLAPERAFKIRIYRVLDEVDRYAGTYLTYQTNTAPLASGHTNSDPSGIDATSAAQREAQRARADGGPEDHSQSDGQPSNRGDTHAE